MKLKCTCGEIITDQTDHLPHKAYIIGDKDYFEFLDVIEAAIKSTDETKDHLCRAVVKAEPSRLAWECTSCGRLYFDDQQGGVIEYLPQSGKAHRIFDRPKS